jgi:glycerol kinase
MPDAVLSIDAGTTSIRVMIVGTNGSVLGRAQKAYPLSYPEKGHVEADPGIFLNNTLEAIRSAIDSSSVSPKDIQAVGITGQRSSLVVWDGSTGEPLTPIVSWQDLRGIGYSQELAAKGIPLSPIAAAVKLPLVMKTLHEKNKSFKQINVRWGNVDTFLAFKLSGETVYATDASFACASGYYDFQECDWNHELADAQGISTDFFPPIQDSDFNFGTTAENVCGFSAPITAIIGDQQSAAFAQGCDAPGKSKLTLGTSATLNIDTGTSILEIPRSYPLVYHRFAGVDTYCVEAMVITAGAMLDWSMTTLGLAESVGELEALAQSVDSSAGVKVLPALQGLGSPHNNPGQLAAIQGLSRATTSAHIARAVYEGIVFRVREMVDSCSANSDLPDPPHQCIDGGLSQSGLIRQLLADALKKPVYGFNPAEATAFGTAMLATRHIASNDPMTSKSDPTIVEPSEQQDSLSSLFDEWKNAWDLGSR